jgi:hypothetical protein
LLIPPKIKKKKNEPWTEPRGTRILFPLPLEIRMLYPKVSSISFISY